MLTRRRAGTGTRSQSESSALGGQPSSGRSPRHPRRSRLDTIHKVIDASMILGDGRTLAYTECGTPGGPAVLYSHSAPASRLELTFLEERFRQLGVRVISPDRPGYGRSSSLPGRGLEDWPRDVAALTGHLRIERFTVAGFSSGGPYALACAAAMPGRITGTGVAAGVTDMGWAPAWDGFFEPEADLMRVGDEAEATRRCEERYGSDGSGYAGLDLDLGPSDIQVLQDEATTTALFASMIEAFRQGIAGYAQDITVQGRPWSFDPARITSPTKILHGAQDTFAPPAHARHTAEIIPGASLTLLEGHGHLSLIQQLPALAASLT